jgi:hypothetical protein
MPLYQNFMIEPHKITIVPSNKQNNKVEIKKKKKKKKLSLSLEPTVRGGQATYLQGLWG